MLAEIIITVVLFLFFLGSLEGLNNRDRYQDSKKEE